jgi:hypothetical protein
MTARPKRPNLTRLSSPSVLPVLSAVRSQISCTAVLNGRVTKATQVIE